MNKQQIHRIANGGGGGRILAAALLLVAVASIVAFQEAQAQTVDNGDFKLIYEENPNSPWIQYDAPTAKDDLQEWGILDDGTAWLNQNLKLPYDVTISAEECNEANAYYIPSEKKVVMCYEYLDGLYNMTRNYNTFDYFEYDNAFFTFYHEIGHALIDIYDLPITGKEENVADQFASLVIYYQFSDEFMTEQHILENVQDAYLIADLERTIDGYEYPYWDTHDSDIQRYYNIACFAYGSDPTYNTYLIDIIPENRIIWCEEEFSQIDRAWQFLLQGHTTSESLFTTPTPDTTPTTPTDATPPTITVLGGINTQITQGDSYVDEGVVCIDDINGIITTITTNPNTIDTTNTGTQTITYTCTDSAGNTSTETRTVTINPPAPTTPAPTTPTTPTTPAPTTPAPTTPAPTTPTTPAPTTPTTPAPTTPAPTTPAESTPKTEQRQAPDDTSTIPDNTSTAPEPKRCR